MGFAPHCERQESGCGIDAFDDDSFVSLVCEVQNHTVFARCKINYGRLSADTVIEGQSAGHQTDDWPD